MRAQKPATIYLLRHGHSTANAKSILAGRDFKVSLSATGKKQALAIESEFKQKNFARIYSSPLPRCLQTLEPIAETLKRQIEISEGVIEMEYGDWSGKKLAILSRTKLWKSIQGRPSLVRFPNGESFGIGRSGKYLPTVGRIDGVYGDRNLVCSCLPIEELASN